MTPLVSGRSPSPQEIQRTNRRLLQKLKLSEEALEEKITSEVGTSNQNENRSATSPALRKALL